MKRITAIIFLVLSVTIITAFSVTASNDPIYDYWQNQQRRETHHQEKIVHTITIDSNNSTVRIQCGDDIRLELPENGTTGYSWHFDERPYEIASEKVEKGSLDGSPAKHIWIFSPKSLAGGDIKMSYYRTWEGKRPDTKRFQVKIAVDCTFR
ncbi:MAG TPA: protease inhibitor I42 family protein [Smithella sp.]|nr:protease inhibitor I42 family protein [Smithella sp.]